MSYVHLKLGITNRHFRGEGVPEIILYRNFEEKSEKPKFQKKNRKFQNYIDIFDF